MLEWNKQHALCSVLTYLGLQSIAAEPYLPPEEILERPAPSFRFLGPHRGLLQIQYLQGPLRDLDVYVCRQIRRGEYVINPRDRGTPWPKGASQLEIYLPEKPGEWLIVCVRNKICLDFCFTTRDYATHPADKSVVLQENGNSWTFRVENRSDTPSDPPPELSWVTALRPYCDSAQELAKTGDLGMTPEEVAIHWNKHSIGISRLVLLVRCGLRVRAVTANVLMHFEETRMEILVKQCWPDYVSFIAELDHPSDEERVWAFFALHGGRRKASMPDPLSFR